MSKVMTLQGTLHERFKTLEEAYSGLGLKERYEEGEAEGYPDKQLVRRVWEYGKAPGDEAVPNDTDIAWNGLRALELRLKK